MRFAVFGNSGSGKSTLARWLARSADLNVLDLDTVAWEPGRTAVARASEEAEAEVAEFCARRPRWVVEGCYGNLIEASLPFEPFLVFLDPGREACIAHCRSRPWEPHKHASRQEQDAHLENLLSWVAEYETRDGPMSLRAHRAIFDRYAGRKAELRRVPRLSPPEDELLAWLR